MKRTSANFGRSFAPTTPSTSITPKAVKGEFTSNRPNGGKGYGNTAVAAKPVGKELSYFELLEIKTNERTPGNHWAFSSFHQSGKGVGVNIDRKSPGFDKLVGPKGGKPGNYYIMHVVGNSERPVREACWAGPYNLVPRLEKEGLGRPGIVIDAVFTYDGKEHSIPVGSPVAGGGYRPFKEMLPFQGEFTKGCIQAFADRVELQIARWFPAAQFPDSTSIYNWCREAFEVAVPTMEALKHRTIELESSKTEKGLVLSLFGNYTLDGVQYSYTVAETTPIVETSVDKLEGYLKAFFSKEEVLKECIHPSRAKVDKYGNAHFSVADKEDVLFEADEKFPNPVKGGVVYGLAHKAMDYIDAFAAEVEAVAPALSEVLSNPLIAEVEDIRGARALAATMKFTTDRIIESDYEQLCAAIESFPSEMAQSEEGCEDFTIDGSKMRVFATSPKGDIYIGRIKANENWVAPVPVAQVKPETVAAVDGGLEL